MKLTPTVLPEVKRVTLDVFHDERGFFTERFHRETFASLGFSGAVAQINHSRSNPGVIRGMHFQHAPAQGKLVGVTRGRVLDVAVDLRPHSVHFMQHVAVELSGDNGEMLWIPPGFGHGFCVLGDEAADMVYAVDAPYNAAGEAGVRFDDAQLHINWPVINPILSARDRALPTLAALTPQLKKWFPA
ncbi:MAG: dTDP-4-dehydrorhamnose 3,5-epimerase [Rickettsiales bacterium]